MAQRESSAAQIIGAGWEPRLDKNHKRVRRALVCAVVTVNGADKGQFLANRQIVQQAMPKKSPK
jgi:hypothetical protein